MQFLFRYANPHNFMRLSGAVLPFTAIATALCIPRLYLGFAPPDYQQGRTVLIMFIHVPAATVAMSIYVPSGMLAAVAGVAHPVRYRARAAPLWARCLPPWA